MQEYPQQIETAAIETDSLLSVHVTDRLIALWALSEAALGGLLHALHIPLTGLFVGGAAVLIITIMAFIEPGKYVIIRATLIVMTVKLVVSPHAPINAYIAVMFQGMLGEFLFRSVRSFKLAALLLGFFSLMESALQRLVVITLVFGMNIWKSLDLFARYVLEQISITGMDSAPGTVISIVVVVYIMLHLATGVSLGLWAPFLACQIKDDIRAHPFAFPTHAPSAVFETPTSRKRSRLGKRISYIAVVGIAFSIFILSYAVPVFEKSRGFAALVMILRSLVIITLWYYMLAPFLMKKLRKFLEKRQMKYHREVGEIVNVLPLMRQVIYHNWKHLRPGVNPRKLTSFIRMVLVYLLTADFYLSEK